MPKTWPGKAKMRKYIKRIRQANVVAKRLRGRIMTKRCPSCYGAPRYCKNCLGTGEVDAT
jgi:hypothetical protein